MLGCYRGIKTVSKVKMEKTLELSSVEWENDPFAKAKPEPSISQLAAIENYKAEQARAAENRRQFEEMTRSPVATLTPDSPAITEIKLPFDLSKNRLIRAAGLEEYVRERQRTARERAVSAVLNAGMGAAVNEFKQAKQAGEGTVTPNINPRIGSLPFLPTWPPNVSASETKLTEAASNFVKHGLISQLAVKSIDPKALDLVTTNLREEKVNLRERIVHPNTVTLVLISSSSYSIAAARRMQRVFHDIFVAQPETAEGESLTRLELIKAAISGDLFDPDALEAAGDGEAIKLPSTAKASEGSQAAQSPPPFPFPLSPVPNFSPSKLSTEEQVGLVDNAGVKFQTALLNVADGWIAKTFFARSMRKELALITPPELHESTYYLFTTGPEDVVSRTRLWLDATNRFAASAYLVDSYGCIRWRGRTAEEVPSERLLIAMSKAALKLGAETGHYTLAAKENK